MEAVQGRQTGVTLVELMIAMLIGLFLLEGVLYIFQSSKSGARLIEAEATMHDNALFAIESLNHTIRMTGHNDYDNVTSTYDPSLTYADIAIPGGTNGDVIQGSEGASGAPDTIIVYFKGAADGTTLDCLGGTVAAGTVVRNTFSINANNELECAVGAQPAQPLVSGVTDMQVTWGIDNDADGEADQFVSYASLNTATARDRIVALIIQLTLASSVGNESISNKIFTTAVALRNKLP